MTTIIGNVQILDYDIHYGYEGGYFVNFTIESKVPLTDEQATNVLLKHFNPKPIEQLKKEWKPFMPEIDDFNLDLTFGKHSKWANQTVIIINK